MFLAHLAKEQKEAFLDLAQTLVMADGIFHRDEASMMEQYKLEMALPSDVEGSQERVEQAIDIFKAAPLTIKKQVIFELVALAYADNDYADEEDCLIQKVMAAFGLDRTFLLECREYVNELTVLYTQIRTLISG